MQLVLRMCYGKSLQLCKPTHTLGPELQPARANKGNPSMHKGIPRTTAISPAIGGSEIPDSEANRPHLKFVVKYREGAKRKQKVFEKEEEAIQFARTKNRNFRRDPI